MGDPLTLEEKIHLLDMAEAAIFACVEGKPLPTSSSGSVSPRLANPGASFVTINIDDQLRGCIGTIEARLSLVDDVIKNASSAATADPRFSPITRDELDNILVEVSVLSTPKALLYSTPDELLDSLNPNVDGVIVKKGIQRATFLPQVWKKVDDPADFLSRLCQKAHLDENAWQDESLEVHTYQVESFSRKE